MGNPSSSVQIHISTSSLLYKNISSINNFNPSICLDAERGARVSEREEPSVTARFFVTTSRVSQSLRSDVSPVVVVSSVSQPVCTILLMYVLAVANQSSSDLRGDPWCSEDF